MVLLKYLNDKSLFILSLLLTLIGSYFSYGFFHPDEQYYVIDFAAYKAGILRELSTWEYHTQLRPWLLIAIFTPILSVLKSLDASPFLMAWSLRLLSGIFSWFCLVRFNLTLKRIFPGSPSYNIFIFFTHFSFFSFFMRLRTTSENWSTAFILLSCSYLLKKSPYLWDLLMGGLLLGLAFGLRHQTGFISLGLGLWLLFDKKTSSKDWFGLFVPSIIAGVLIGILADFWGYDQITLTPWNYIYQNLVLSKIDQFGTSPFYAYLIWIFKDLTPFWGIIFVLGYIRLPFLVQKSWVLWSTTAFIVVHFIIGHKELRFLYPVTPFILFSSAFWFTERQLQMSKVRRYFYKSLVFVNAFLLIFVTFKPAHTPLGAYAHLYKHMKSNELKVFKDELGRYVNPDLSFYKKNNLIITPVEVHDRKLIGIYLTTKYKELKIFKKNEGCKQVYSAYPNWILDFNFFNWVERSSIWVLTECT